MKCWMEYKVVEVRALLASAVKEGIMIRGRMKNKNQTPYWYFTPTDIKGKDKEKK